MTMGLYVEVSASKRAACVTCGDVITDKFRVVEKVPYGNTISHKYHHIKCAYDKLRILMQQLIGTGLVSDVQ